MCTKIVALYIMLLACNQTVRNRDSQGSPTDLYQYWIHSYEEDETAKQLWVYRPDTYAFPPARGRDGFEIKENGVFIAHPIAPTDGSLSIEEKWTLDKDKLMVVGENGEYGFTIISVSKDKLVLKSL